MLYAASRVPVLIVSGAAHAEIAGVLDAAGLADAVTAVISSDTVTDGKPHPEGYLRALTVLRDRAWTQRRPGRRVRGHRGGVASAKAAGVRCIAVAGTLPAERLAAADSIVRRSASR